jgi:glycosyltransferase involved in cell wall biosynthesis
VFATFIAGIPELVRNGETGWLVPAASVDELTRAMEHCLHATPEELQRMGEAARRRVTERHSMNGQAAILAQLFLALSQPSLSSASSSASGSPA